MHRALNIAEIVHLIFAHLISPVGPLSHPHDPSRETPQHNGSLAALARTCTRFRDPALDLLWREQNTLTNLLRCLGPAHLWEGPLDVHESPQRRVFRIKGSIQSADCQSLLAHACRIRRLSLNLEQMTICGDSVFDMIRELPRDFLCPNLTSLHLNVGQIYLVPRAGLFFLVQAL
ncbi:hypothetical protein R3P38DRAFT_946621 [Favolaschia claudopus]|uniref:F-box domain-containing protein n=1 Tax=Favolaschia claudopus TaxID=2862362 RepID=A0AAW0BLW4_9AGAR